MNLEISQGSMGATMGALFIGVFLGSAAAVAESSSSAVAGAEGQIEEIVVTAQRRDQDVQDVPISMTALSGDTLNVYRLEQARQLASVVPNLNVLQTYGENVAPIITIRGVNSQGWSFGDPSTTTVYSDDVPLNNTWAHGFALYDLERVEVLRGPQGTLFGRNSTAGAMHFVSAGPGQELDGYARLTQGNYGKSRIEAAVGGPVSDRLGLRVAGVWEEADGAVKNIPDKGDAAWVDYSAMRFVLDFQATDDLDIRFKGQFGQSDGAPMNLHNSLRPHPFTAMNTEGYDGTRFNNPGPASDYTESNLSLTDDEMFEDLDVTQLGLTINWQLGDDLLLTSVTGFLDVDSLSVYDEDSSALDIITTVGDHAFDGVSQELRLASNNDSPFQWIIGGFYSDDSSESTFVIDLTDLYRVAYYFPATSASFAGVDTGYGALNDYEMDTSSWALFAHTSYEWTDKFTTTIAVRHTEDDLDLALSTDGYTEFPKTSALSFVDKSIHETYGGTISRTSSDAWDGTTWRVGAEYSAKDDLLYYASISTGYKSGKQNLYGTYGYPVAPENVTSYEVGVKSRLSDNRVTLNAAVFYYDYSDYQTYEYLPNPPGVENATGYTFVWGNIPEVSYWGAEIEMLARPVENLNIRLAYGFVESEIEQYFDDAPIDFTGNTILNINDSDFSALISYDFSLGDKGSLSPQFESSYMGDLHPDTANVAPILDGYWTHNASLNYRSSGGRVGVSAFVENMSDDVNLARQFYTETSIGTTGFNVTRPRTYGVTISVEL